MHTVNSRRSAPLLVAAALAALASLSPTRLTGQQMPAQADFRWSKAIAAGSTVRVSNLNGNVTIMASNTDKVEVAGVARGPDADEVTVEVVEWDNGITVCAIFKRADTECTESGMRSHSNRRRGRDWDDARIDITVSMPKSMRAIGGSVSGDVQISGAEGDVSAASVSGDVRLESLRATAVKATTVSGDVDVAIAALTGSGDLEFTSVSGDVTVSLPRDLDADVTMRSVSGSLDSDFPLTLNGRMNRGRLEARIGKGGRDLEVHTVSGDVRLRMANR